MHVLRGGVAWPLHHPSEFQDVVHEDLARRRVRCDEQGILKALRGGQSVRKTAARFGVSASKVQRVMAGARVALN